MPVACEWLALQLVVKKVAVFFSFPEKKVVLFVAKRTLTAFPCLSSGPPILFQRKNIATSVSETIHVSF
jgi:hypothetical protein